MTVVNAAQHVLLCGTITDSVHGPSLPNDKKIHIIGWEGHITYLLIDFSFVKSCTLLGKSVLSVAITRKLRS